MTLRPWTSLLFLACFLTGVGSAVAAQLEPPQPLSVEEWHALGRILPFHPKPVSKEDADFAAAALDRWSSPEGLAKLEASAKADEARWAAEEREGWKRSGNTPSYDIDQHAAELARKHARTLISDVAKAKLRLYLATRRQRPDDSVVSEEDVAAMIALLERIDPPSVDAIYDYRYGNENWKVSPEDLAQGRALLSRAGSYKILYLAAVEIEQARLAAMDGIMKSALRPQDRPLFVEAVDERIRATEESLVAEIAIAGR